MSDYDNELRGVLFKVPDDKKTSKGPGYRGEATIRGQKYRVSAWVQKSQQGRFYMSLSFQKDDGEYEAKKRSQAPLERDESGQKLKHEASEDDGIPF